MQDLKQCVRYTLGHRGEWLFLTVQDKLRKTKEVATIEVFTDARVALVRMKASETRLKCTVHESGEVTETMHESRVNPAVENF